MKNRCKILNIAFCELKTQWRGFAIFFIISCLLISSMISIFSLAKQMPDEIQEYISLSFFDTIEVNDIEPQDLEFIESLPVNINSYSNSGLESEAIGIPEDTTKESEGFTVYFDGSAQKWLADGKSPKVDMLNDIMVSGKKWEEADNNRKVIWLSTETADMLGKKCGDTVTLNIENAVKTVECTVEGIYKWDPGNSNYYLPLPLYIECMGDNLEPFRAIITPKSIKDYRIVINKLNSMYLQLRSQIDFIDSLMFLIYALYMLCGFLCLLEVSIMVSISKLYFHKRNNYYAILKALGMKNTDIFKIVFLVMEFLLAASFIISMFIAPILSRHVINLVSELFADVKLSTNVWTRTSAFLFIGASVLLWSACLINKSYYRSTSIIKIMQKNSQ